MPESAPCLPHGQRLVSGLDRLPDRLCYEVLAIERGPRPLGTWPVWDMTVRYEQDGREATHCRGWDAAKDRVLPTS
ncbi:hypothetical protein [Streptomyces lavendofoliae]|uniref:hypothetical protein n=1 Tax=Streptomyces lavendofoliae TaxID=67314 RepID=UPI003D932C57